MKRFDHERMDVYQRALVFVRLAAAMRKRLAHGHAALGDQLDRAAVSVALNIAEGAGEFSRKEKARFCRMARRSATESAAVLDVVGMLKLADRQDVCAGKVLLLEIVGSLVGLSRKMEDEARTRR